MHAFVSREKLRTELEAWAPPFISGTFGRDFSIQFPKKANLAVMTYDIIQSSKLHGLEYQKRPIHAHILDGYTHSIIRHGGWRESSSGDSAYAHFGIIKDLKSPTNSAFAAATEFRVFLRNLAQASGVDFECGIAIHYAPECTVDIHEIKVQAFGQDVIHKSFQSSSIEIDLVHRMEKLMHDLPGSNIVMSKDFVQKLDEFPEGVLELGNFQLKGQSQSVELLIKPSYFTKDYDINKLRLTNGLPELRSAV
jgi:class 3 adenylate cyclase